MSAVALDGHLLPAAIDGDFLSHVPHGYSRGLVVALHGGWSGQHTHGPPGRMTTGDTPGSQRTRPQTRGWKPCIRRVRRISLLNLSPYAITASPVGAAAHAKTVSTPRGTFRAYRVVLFLLYHGCVACRGLCACGASHSSPRLKPGASWEKKVKGRLFLMVMVDVGGTAVTQVEDESAQALVGGHGGADAAA